MLSLKKRKFRLDFAKNYQQIKLSSYLTRRTGIKTMENSWSEENNNTWKTRCKAILSAQVQWNAAKLVDNNLEQSQGFCISLHHAEHKDQQKSHKSRQKHHNGGNQWWYQWVQVTIYCKNSQWSIQNKHFIIVFI